MKVTDEQREEMRRRLAAQDLSREQLLDRLVESSVRVVEQETRIKLVEGQETKAGKLGAVGEDLLGRTLRVYTQAPPEVKAVLHKLLVHTAEQAAADEVLALMEPIPNPATSPPPRTQRERAEMQRYAAEDTEPFRLWEKFVAEALANRMEEDAKTLEAPPPLDRRDEENEK